MRAWWRRMTDLPHEDQSLGVPLMGTEIEGGRDMECPMALMMPPMTTSVLKASPREVAALKARRKGLKVGRGSKVPSGRKLRAWAASSRREGPGLGGMW